MPRPPVQPNRDDIAADELEAHDAVVQRQVTLWSRQPGDAGIYYGPMLNTPSICLMLSDGGRLFRQAQIRGTFPNRDREFTDLLVATELGWTYAFRGHLPDALAEGVPTEQVKALRRGQLDALEPGLRQLADYVHGVLDGTVTDEMFEGIEERFGHRGAIEYTAFVSWLMMTARTMQALALEAPTEEELDGLIREFEEGSRELPEPAVHVG